MINLQGQIDPLLRDAHRHQFRILRPFQDLGRQNSRLGSDNTIWSMQEIPDRVRGLNTGRERVNLGRVAKRKESGHGKKGRQMRNRETRERENENWLNSDRNDSNNDLCAISAGKRETNRGRKFGGKKVLLDSENEGGLLLSKCGWDLKSFSCHQQFEKVSKKFAN